MSQAKKIGIVGLGNMGEALLRGLIAANLFPADDIHISTPRAERRDAIKQRYQVHATTHNLDVVRHVDVLLIAVKPKRVLGVLAEIAPALRPNALVISVAAGVSTEQIEVALPTGVRVVRAMPNTPALVGAAATALCGGSQASEEDVAQAKAIFSSVGIALEVEEEALDAVTGLSGSGPAYVFLILEALSDAGVKMGLSRPTAQTLAAQTLMGAAKLLLETNEHPGRLKDMVTSPGGTAIAGIATLEAGGLRTTLINAVEEATRRSRELGQKGE